MATTVKGSKSNADNKLANPAGAVNDLALDKWVTVFPNPSTGRFQVFSSKFVFREVEIFDLYGAKVYAERPATPSNLFTINLNLPDGVYFVKLFSEGAVIVKKAVISR